MSRTKPRPDPAHPGMINPVSVRGMGIPWRWWLLALMLAVGVMPGRSAEPNLNPEEFKAITLAKISPYVQWPKAVLADAGTNFVVGIFGTNSIGPMLAALLKGQKVGGRDVIVKNIPADTTALPRCHLLFISAEQESQWQLLSKDADTFGLLTVGESETFTKSGGVFNLLVSQQKLEIDLKNAKRAGLEINSKLLRISKVIR